MLLDRAVNPAMTARCAICGSPEHEHRGGPICPDGYRRDYEPGKHDPHTGETLGEPPTREVTSMNTSHKGRQLG